MEIYLVRHTTPDVEEGICYGQSDLAVKADFDSMLENIVQMLPREKLPVYSSPLKRCLKLANGISSDILVDDRLMELNFGDWELMKWEDIPTEDTNVWMDNYFENAPPNGESMNQMIERVSTFLYTLNHKKVILVTHHGVIKTIAGICNAMPQSEWMSIKVEYGGILQVSFKSKQGLSNI